MSSRKRAVSLLGEPDPVDAVALGPLQERVVDVGDVLDVVNLPLGVEPHALDEVERVDVSRPRARDFDVLRAPG